MARGYSGFAYVFVRSGRVWRQQQRLTNSVMPSGHFGWSVAVNDDTALVGAVCDDAGGSCSGSASVFVRSGGVWSQQQKLVASDAAESDRAGWAVAISGHTAVVGAICDSDAGLCSGSAYVFVRSAGAWTQQQKLTASDASLNDQFGSSVAISGDTALVGSIYDDDTAANSGSAYVFVRNGKVWSQQQKLTVSDAAADDNFGLAVSVSGDTAVVGAPFHDGRGSDSGSAYVFERNGNVWSQRQELTASDGAAGDLFGRSVSISAKTVVVGAVADDTSTGSAYVYSRR
jgi:hypothetical protein